VARATYRLEVTDARGRTISALEDMVYGDACAAIAEYAPGSGAPGRLAVLETTDKPFEAPCSFAHGGGWVRAWRTG
jgi:hypothetical protein